MTTAAELSSVSTEILIAVLREREGWLSSVSTSDLLPEISRRDDVIVASWDVGSLADLIADQEYDLTFVSTRAFEAAAQFLIREKGEEVRRKISHAGYEAIASHFDTCLDAILKKGGFYRYEIAVKITAPSVEAATAARKAIVTGLKEQADHLGGVAEMGGLTPDVDGWTFTVSVDNDDRDDQDGGWYEEIAKTVASIRQDGGFGDADAEVEEPQMLLVGPTA